MWIFLLYTHSSLYNIQISDCVMQVKRIHTSLKTLYSTYMLSKALHVQSMAAEHLLSPKVRTFYKVLKRKPKNIITLLKTGCQLNADYISNNCNKKFPVTFEQSCLLTWTNLCPYRTASTLGCWWVSSHELLASSSFHNISIILGHNFWLCLSKTFTLFFFKVGGYILSQYNIYKYKV